MISDEETTLCQQRICGIVCAERISLLFTSLYIVHFIYQLLCCALHLEEMSMFGSTKREVEDLFLPTGSCLS